MARGCGFVTVNPGGLLFFYFFVSIMVIVVFHNMASYLFARGTRSSVFLNFKNRLN